MYENNTQTITNNSKCPMCSSGNFPSINGMHRCVECGNPVHALDGCSFYRNNNETRRICSICFDLLNSKTINTSHEANTVFQDTAENKDIQYSVDSDQSLNGYTLLPISPRTCIVAQGTMNEISELSNDGYEISEFSNDGNKLTELSNDDQSLGCLTVSPMSNSIVMGVEANEDSTNPNTSYQSLNGLTKEPIHNMSSDVKNKRKHIENNKHNDEDTAKENWYRNNKKKLNLI